jgi:hypothetical protein
MVAMMQMSWSENPTMMSVVMPCGIGSIEESEA